MVFIILYYQPSNHPQQSFPGASMSLTDRAIRLATKPLPLRTVVLRKLLSRWPVGSYKSRLHAGAVYRPHYGWCSYYAAIEAKALGHKAMTIVELGVAGGLGLVCLCQHKKEIEREVGIEIVLVGFDTGAGLPASGDARDLLYCWPTGSFEMDREALERRLAGNAELVFGDIAKTAESWNPRADAPLGAIMFDLDYYSSTMGAFTLLTKSNMLPRVWCYFDDILGYPHNAYTDRIGVREAIREFGTALERRSMNDHLSQAYVFQGLEPEAWHDQIYMYHRLSHPKYNVDLSKGEKSRLCLTP
jgi:hypothetical protein